MKWLDKIRPPPWPPSRAAWWAWARMSTTTTKTRRPPAASAASTSHGPSWKRWPTWACSRRILPSCSSSCPTFSSSAATSFRTFMCQCAPKSSTSQTTPPFWVWSVSWTFRLVLVSASWPTRSRPRTWTRCAPWSPRSRCGSTVRLLLSLRSVASPSPMPSVLPAWTAWPRRTWRILSAWRSSPTLWALLACSEVSAAFWDRFWEASASLKYELDFSFLLIGSFFLRRHFGEVFKHAGRVRLFGYLLHSRRSLLHLGQHRHEIQLVQKHQSLQASQAERSGCLRTSARALF